MRALAWFGVAGCGGVGLDPETTDQTDCGGAEPFVAGLAATTPGGITVAIADAAPAPPDVGDNTWTLTLTGADGAPITGAAPVVTPFMPLHGHGLAPADYGAVETEPGRYEVEVFDLIMPGVWEFTVRAAPGDEAVFELCAEG